MIDITEIVLITTLMGLFLILITWNVTLRIALAQARHEANTDDLTGLPNRRALLAHLGTMLADGRGPISAAIVDLNHFKEVNDQFGHAAGDAVLRHASNTLKTLPLDDAYVGRLSGDEFLILTRGGSDAAGKNAQTVITAMKDTAALVDAPSMPYEATLIPYAVSIGYAIADTKDHTVGDLLREADTAMYAAKERTDGIAQHQPWMTPASQDVASRRRANR